MRTLIALSLLIQDLSSPIPHHDEPHLKPHSIICDEKGVQEASQAALKQIALHHHHGYKYRLTNTTSSKFQKKDDTFCIFHLELELEESKCHLVNPKPLEECEVRRMDETKVESKCNITLTVIDGGTTAERYSCKSEPASAEEIVKVCPDCPTLLPLSDHKGLESIKEAMKKFHEETNKTSYFILLEVGRVSTQYTFLGQFYFAEFAIVETNCSRQENSEKSNKCKMLSKGEAHLTGHHHHHHDFHHGG